VVNVLALPMQSVGLSVEHVRFPGTLTLSAETLIAVLTDIGRSVAAAGVRRLVILNSTAVSHRLSISSAGVCAPTTCSP
jgi:creatinine amidohydrolase